MNSMKISYHSHIGGLDTSQGYGIAGQHIVHNLERLGHKVPFNDPTADVILNFTQPPYYQFHGKQYNIGYTPWESSVVEPSWIDPMMAVDELWTTSPLIAQWFQENGADREIKIFEHGIDHRWVPKYRRPHKKLRFLHVGADAARKGGQDTFDAFIDAFGPDNENVSLTFKTHASYLMIRKYEGTGLLHSATHYAKNVRHLHGTFSFDEMLALFYSHDILVYPSYGEGFGFIPLQALASGMPTIQNDTWAPYKRFVIPELSVDDSMCRSPWPLEHPGQVLKPDHDSLVNSMLFAYNNFEKVSLQAFNQAPDVHDDYDWLNLVRKQFDPVVAKVNSM